MIHTASGLLLPDTRLTFPRWNRGGMGDLLDRFWGAFQGAFIAPFGGAAAAVSWWEAGGATGCVAAYQPKGAASLAASYTNLANPGTNDAAPGVAPTWDATNGWMFIGGTQYLTTGVIPANDQTWSMLLRFSDQWEGAPGQCAMGAVGNVPWPEFRVTGYYTASQCRYSNGNAITVAPGLLAGVLAVAGTTAYRNGVAEGAAIGATAGVIPAIFIGARNLYGTGVDEFAGVYVQAAAIYNVTLTAPMVAAVTAAMAAL